MFNRNRCCYGKLLRSSRLDLKKMIPKKYSNLVYILLMGLGMSLLMTLIITYVNTGFDVNYVRRFLKAWSVSLPIAIGTVLVVGPLVKKFVDKYTN